ncbi:hypothetical protein [Acinetobacter baumannii]|uniref:hypothetical protein n=1 Tax=Acinetobacter baumannii TaxID=470 RepID=UPI002278FE3D|nr:hypothetical protein [Acinetobacter baumannii]
MVIRYLVRWHGRFPGPVCSAPPDDSYALERWQHGANAANGVWIMLNRGLPGEVNTDYG